MLASSSSGDLRRRRVLYGERQAIIAELRQEYEQRLVEYQQELDRLRDENAQLRGQPALWSVAPDATPPDEESGDPLEAQAAQAWVLIQTVLWWYANLYHHKKQLEEARRWERDLYQSELDPAEKLQAWAIKEQIDRYGTDGDGYARVYCTQSTSTRESAYSLEAMTRIPKSTATRSREKLEAAGVFAFKRVEVAPKVTHLYAKLLPIAATPAAIEKPADAPQRGGKRAPAICPSCNSDNVLEEVQQVEYRTLICRNCGEYHQYRIEKEKVVYFPECPPEPEPEPIQEPEPEPPQVEENSEPPEVLFVLDAPPAPEKIQILTRRRYDGSSCPHCGSDTLRKTATGWTCAGCEGV